jgi:signal transduction histidine kinase/CheY-like chemotaxis protein
MKLPHKLLLMCVVCVMISIISLFGIRHGLRLSSVSGQIRGLIVEFQAQVLALDQLRDRQTIQRDMLGLVDTLDELGRMLDKVGPSVQFHRSDLSELRDEISRLSEQGKSAFRSQDLERYAGYSSLWQSLSRMCEWEGERGALYVKVFSLGWILGFVLVGCFGCLVYWLDYHRKLNQISCQLAVWSGGDDSAGFHPLADLGDVEKHLTRLHAQRKERSEGEGAFLAEMSHEIRTPLNGIIGFLSNLGETQLNAQQKQYLKIIESSARSLLHVISEILDYSKINAGAMELEIVAFDLRALAEDRIALASQLAKAKGLKMNLVFPGHEAVIVRGDPNRLRQVLDNLLGNAVKFTNRGEVCLEIQTGNADDNQVVVDIAVKDTGIGIAQEKLPNLFQPFTQADSSVSRKYGGTGLGLCISSSLVKLMGGKLEVWSRLGEGSRFYFMLTMCRARAEEQVRLPGSFKINLPRQELKKHWALLVDDTPTNLFLLETVCQSVGLPYRTANNGAEAVELCLKQKFDVIFMDIQMPVMDGYTAIREIRKLPTSGMTGIVALTASAFPEDVERALAAGATGFIAKPFERNQLLMCIADALLLEPERETLPENDVIEDDDEATVRHMHDFMREQYQISLGEIKMTLAQTVSDWRPLLDNLRIYAKKGNVPDTKAILHRLKGQLSSIGLTRQSEQAALIMECLSGDEVTEQALASIEELISELGRIFKVLEQDVTVG